MAGIFDFYILKKHLSYLPIWFNNLYLLPPSLQMLVITNNRPFYLNILLLDLNLLKGFLRTNIDASYFCQLLLDLDILNILLAAVTLVYNDVSSGLFQILLGEVGSANWAGEIFEAPGIDASGVENVLAWSLPYYFRKLYILQADRTDLLLRAQLLSWKGWHQILKVFDVIVSWLGYGRHNTLCIVSSSSTSKNEDRNSNNDNNYDHNDQRHENVVINEDSSDDLLRNADSQVSWVSLGIISNTDDEQFILAVWLAAKRSIGRDELLTA